MVEASPDFEFRTFIHESDSVRTPHRPLVHPWGKGRRAWSNVFSSGGERGERKTVRKRQHREECIARRRVSGNDPWIFSGRENDSPSAKGWLVGKVHFQFIPVEVVSRLFPGRCCCLSIVRGLDMSQR